MKYIILLCIMMLCAVSSFADTAVLYIGRSWLAMSPALEKTWQAVDLPDVPKVIVDRGDDNHYPNDLNKAFNVPLETYPAIARFTDQGQCVGIYQGFNTTITAQAMTEALVRFGKATPAVSQSNKLSTEELFLALEGNLTPGEMKRLYGKQWKAFEKSQSPEFYRLAFNPSAQATYKVQGFAEAKDYAAGEAYIQELETSPKYAKLSIKQRQGIALLRFVLYKNDTTKQELANQALLAGYQMDPTSLYGVGAQGYLCLRGLGPVTFRHGWRPNNVKSGDNQWDIAINALNQLEVCDSYQVEVKRNKGKGAFQIKEITLMIDGQPFAQSLSPAFIPPRCTGTFVLKRINHAQFPKDLVAQHLAKGALRIRFTAANADNSVGQISLKNTPQPDFPAPAVAFSQPKTPLGLYAYDLIGQETIQAQIALGRSGVVNRFFNDTTLLEDFFLSGPASHSWKMSFETLMRFLSLDLEVPETWLVALALNETDWGHNLCGWIANPKTYPSTDPLAGEIALLKVMKQLKADGYLHMRMDSLSLADLRYVFIPNQMPANSVDYLGRKTVLPWARYGDACWTCPYRLESFFGDSIHTSSYHMPWLHEMLMPVLAKEVGMVCGGISHYGSILTRAHGHPSVPAGQPGHCAFMSLTPFGTWTIYYSVNPYTDMHWTFWGARFAFANVMERTMRAKHYKASMRIVLQAEHIILKQDSPRFDSAIDDLFVKAYQTEPSNYAALVHQAKWYKQVNAPKEAWLKWTEALVASYADTPDAIYHLLESEAKETFMTWPLAERTQFFINIQKHLRQNDTKLPEYYDYTRMLNHHRNWLNNDTQAVFAFFEEACLVQAGTRTAFAQILEWGANNYLKGKTEVAFEKLLVKIATNHAIDTQATKRSFANFLRQPILKAAQAGDIQTFHKFNALAHALEKHPPLRKSVPLKLQHEPLLSAAGVMWLSTTSGWDNPMAYSATLDDKQNQGLFHTNNEQTPYAIVKLPGKSIVSSIYLQNRDSNQWRAMPLAVWVSTDKQHWTQVWSTDKNAAQWEFKLEKPLEAQYVKVGRLPSKSYEPFHLHKIMIFGKKLW